MGASVVNGMVFAPFELVSTRSKSVGATARSFRLLFEMGRREGLVSLWKGSSWFILGNGVSRTIWLATYAETKACFVDRGYDPNLAVILAGGLSGMITATVSSPIWTLKSFAQLPNYPGLLYPNTTMVRQYRKLALRPRVLMAGTIPSAIYVSLESASQWWIYEQLRTAYQNLNPSDKEISPPINGLIGGCSRAAMIPFTYPLHVLTLRYREHARPVLTNISPILTNTPSILTNTSPILTNTPPILTNTNTMVSSPPIRPSLAGISRTITQQRAWYNGSVIYAARVIPQAAVLFFFNELFRRFI